MIFRRGCCFCWCIHISVSVEMQFCWIMMLELDYLNFRCWKLSMLCHNDLSLQLIFGFEWSGWLCLFFFFSFFNFFNIKCVRCILTLPTTDDVRMSRWWGGVEAQQRKLEKETEENEVKWKRVLYNRFQFPWLSCFVHGGASERTNGCAHVSYASATNIRFQWMSLDDRLLPHTLIPFRSEVCLFHMIGKVRSCIRSHSRLLHSIHTLSIDLYASAYNKRHSLYMQWGFV